MILYSRAVLFSAMILLHFLELAVAYLHLEGVLSLWRIPVWYTSL